MHRVEVKPGEKTRITVGWSEFAIHAKIADHQMLVELLGPDHRMAQLYTLDGRPFSSSVLRGEAGVLETQPGSGQFFAYLDPMSPEKAS